MHEIERKFLLSKPLDDVLVLPHVKIYIEQCYLGGTGDWTVRARRSQYEAVTVCYLTLKKRETDRTCVEIENVIDADNYVKIAAQSNRSLSKIRHVVHHGGHKWEIDLFEHGLVLAEIELSSEDEHFIIPEWLGEEVTQDGNYRSSKIAKDLTPLS